MVTSYHSNIKKGILLAGDFLLKNKKIREVHTGEEKPLCIVEHNSKLVINYKPDVYFVLRNNKKLIFEILDSEEEKQDIIIADVIRSFLVENVNGLVFIFSGDKKAGVRIIEALITISKGLIYKGMPKKELPLENGIIIIKKNLDPEKVKIKIINEFK